MSSQHKSHLAADPARTQVYAEPRSNAAPQLRTACPSRAYREEQRGFTLMEILVATVVLLVGMVAVAQLVPISLTINSGNRTGSTALVIEQRLLEQMLDQPLTVATCTAPACPDAQANTWNLGNAATPKTIVGSPVTMVNNSPAIDFSAGQIPNYFATIADPEDPYGATYDVRWAVVTYVNGAQVTGRRFLVGARQIGGQGYFLPLTLDATIEQ
jgi:prepilin-type N-terminal cleavage/methylation domain-containing protein